MGMGRQFFRYLFILLSVPDADALGFFAESARNNFSDFGGFKTEAPSFIY